MKHVYDDTFFNYIDQGARSSAKALIDLLNGWLAPQRVLDLGCGRGVWLDEWQKAGASTVLGIDGTYVNRDALAINKDDFQSADLTKPLKLDARFDLAQSLEVGEHLPGDASDTLVDSLCQSSDRILFSAAVVGQGGEFHVNEQPLSYWQEKFAARGYRAFDCLRPHLRHNMQVEPWYRYNSIFYASEKGVEGLPTDVTKHALLDNEKLKNAGDLKWRLRKAIVAQLPQSTVTRIAQKRASRIAAKAARPVGQAELGK
ncbi:class I SAM-dependent methyltransferase [Roseovarius sp. 2305UL8-3]|uniref:class I SAM-dependent methyltransferase n=1 Tax=Roseovarius conchicola TaxID=3121636 RepID=UPI003528E3FA